MSSNCVFCKIASHQIPAPRIYDDEKFFCIRDIQPQAKVHLLVIPKKHIPSLDEAYPKTGQDEHETVSDLLATAVKIAREQNVLPHGFRLIINTGDGGGQTVPHLHLHILAGENVGAGLV